MVTEKVPKMIYLVREIPYYYSTTVEVKLSRRRKTLMVN